MSLFTHQNDMLMMTVGKEMHLGFMEPNGHILVSRTHIYRYFIFHKKCGFYR